ADIYTLSLHDALPIFTIEIRTALQAQVDTNAVPTFALTSASCYVVQDQYMVETIDPDWKWTRNSLDVLDVPVLTTGSLDINLPRSEEHTSELQSRENL